MMSLRAVKSAPGHLDVCTTPAKTLMAKAPLERLLEMGSYDRDEAERTLQYVSGDVHVAKQVLDRMAKARKKKNAAVERLRRRVANTDHARYGRGFELSDTAKAAQLSRPAAKPIQPGKIKPTTSAQNWAESTLKRRTNSAYEDQYQ